MDAVWLLTWTTYGTWLPGDERGFVSNVRDAEGQRVRHNEFGTDCDKKMRGLQAYAREQMNGDPIWLNTNHASLLALQFQETAAYRAWRIFNLAIMSNHVHILVELPSELEPEAALQAFKSYASRRLNAAFGKPKSDTWWTKSGSKRRKEGVAIGEAYDYVLRQWNPLLIWENKEMQQPGPCSEIKEPDH